MNSSETPVTHRGRGRGQWMQGQDHKELRRPRIDDKIGCPPKPSSCPVDPGAVGDAPHFTSNLSVTAKEFYPKGYNPPVVENSYNPQVSQEAGDCPGYDQLYPDQLTEIVSHLTLNPGKFDALISPLADTFQTWLSEESTVYAVVDLIVEQSIAEPNFRYTGARLCSYLNNEFLTGEDNSFRRTLLTRCNEEHNAMKNTIYEAPERLRGYILFMAELFMQLELVKGSGERIAILGNTLFEAVLLLLTEPNAENIKCACQVLKLTGPTLDMKEPLNMDQVIQRLRILANSPVIESNVCRLINSVIQLRLSGWGEPSNIPSKPSSSQQSNSYTNEPVFYGPDGQVITPEESQFLQESLRQFPDEDYDEFGDEGELWEPNEEMDEEHKVAFEQFLKMGKNNPDGN